MRQYDPAKHHRRSMRLKGYGYAQAGAYFVTLCTQHRSRFFQNEAMQQIAAQCWLEIPDHFPMIELDEWVIMPDHMHGIIVIGDSFDADAGIAPQRTAPESQRTGVQLNAPPALDNAGAAPQRTGAESQRTGAAPQRTGVQLNAPSAIDKDHNEAQPALADDHDASQRPSSAPAESQRTGVQLNAPTMDFIDHQRPSSEAQCADANRSEPNSPPPTRDPNDRYSLISPHRGTLSVVVRTYKAAVTTLCRRAGYTDFGWQRNYHERIIRTEADLTRIRYYIVNNPVQSKLRKKLLR